MRLFFLNRYFAPDDSATSVILSDLARGLARAGHEVHVLTSRQLYDAPRARLATEQLLDGVHVHRMWTTRFGRARAAGRALDYATFHASAIVLLARLAGRGDVVIAKTDPPMISVAAALVCGLRGCRLVNWLQDVFPEVAIRLDMKLGPLARAALVLRDRSLRAAETNVVLGERMAQHIAPIVGGEYVRVISNWSDGDAIRPVPRERNVLRHAWGLGDRFVVGYSGNLGRAHDFAAIVDAAARLRGRGDLAFLFIGTGRHRAWLEAQCTRLGVEAVRFEPLLPRERLAESLSAADVHLITLRPELEGLIVPSKFYSIAAAGRPAIFIGDPDGEIARLVRDAQCGLVVPHGNGGALAQAITDLAAAPARARVMGERARCLFDERFERSAALARWEELLRSLDARRAS